MKDLQSATYFWAVISTIHEMKKQDEILLFHKETEAVVSGVNKKKRNHRIKYE